jgi:serine phosphatase RsbU (regulator of sigma subunit)
MTIERARLDAAADEEYRLVDRLQRMLLPPARMHGAHYEAHGRYLPASAGLEIGGDWYDASELPDGRVFVSVGDVVGHGPEAAATMSQMKVAISVLASDAGDVSTLLGRLDEAAARIPGALCTTAWVGYFDPSTGVLSYAAAGHLPGFLTIGDRVLRLDG